jgi:hypothetical protein
MGIGMGVLLLLLLLLLLPPLLLSLALSLALSLPVLVLVLILVLVPSHLTPIHISPVPVSGLPPHHVFVCPSNAFSASCGLGSIILSPLNVKCPESIGTGTAKAPTAEARDEVEDKLFRLVLICMGLGLGLGLDAILQSTP